MPYWNPEELLESYLNLALRLSGSAFRVESALEPAGDSHEAAVSPYTAPEAAGSAHTAHEAPEEAVSAHVPPKAAVSMLTAHEVVVSAHTAPDAAVPAHTAHISFCKDVFIPTRTHLTYNNDKPWYTAKLRQLCPAKENAYRKGGKVLYKQAKYPLEREIRVAKRNYSEKLRIQFSSIDSTSVWKGLKEITTTRHHPPALWRINNWQTI